MLALLSQLKEKGIINAADYYFAEFIHRKQQPFQYASSIQNLAVLMAALCNFSHPPPALQYGYQRSLWR